MNAKMKAPKIFWTSREWLEVAKSVRLAKLDDNLTMNAAIRIGQQILPENRRRPEKTFYTIADHLRKVVFKELDAADRNPAGKFAPALETAQESGSPLLNVNTFKDPMPHVNVDNPIQIVKDGLAKPSFEDSIMTRMTAFASVIAAKFEQELLTQLQSATERAMDTVDRNFHQRLTNARKAVKTSKAALPKVLVVGLQGSQPHDIMNEYGEMLDLRFVESTGSMSVLKASAKHVDYVVLMTQFISHKHQDAVRDHEGLIYANGNVSNLKDVLLPIACR